MKIVLNNHFDLLWYFEMAHVLLIGFDDPFRFHRTAHGHRRHYSLSIYEQKTFKKHAYLVMLHSDFDCQLFILMNVLL